ncbi:hypothetical protein TIFTF001_053296 [Ficus carica]|uniref:C-JID domain-containing protein n=2 Tax=Ficus carica TaxID=3494 RepID=A0AA88EPQ5_FICCA|nr:hypothetical protein TIFTF001_053294 [Ficus carica]GMN74999.1 hypothetical protein TIFTF001_053296 [Ficus carica]
MFLFVNCQKLDLNARNNIIADAQLRIWKAAIQLGKIDHNSVLIYCPGEEIPMWFSSKAKGCSIKMKLPPSWFSMDFLGFALCVAHASVDCYLLCFQLQVCLSNGGGQEFNFSRPFHYSRKEVDPASKLLASDHIMLFFNKCLNRQVKEMGEDWCCNVTEASFRITALHQSDNKCVKELGICLLYAEDVEKAIPDKSQGKKLLKQRDRTEELGQAACSAVVSRRKGGEEDSDGHRSASKKVKFM